MQKSAKLFTKLFDYIYTTKYQKKIFLAQYNDLNYILNQKKILKILSKLCYNYSSCYLKEPNFFKKSSFINTILAKFRKTTCKQIAYKTAKLRK